MVEQPADELEGDVLEGERRSVEQLEHPFVGPGLDQRCGRRVAERGVGLAAHGGEGGRVELALDERRHHRRGDRRVVAADRPVRQRRPRLRDVQPAVGGEPREHGVGETQPGADPRVETYSHRQRADHPQEAADLLDHVEVTQLSHRRLDVGFPGIVGDEHQPGLVLLALLLGGADAHAVTGEHPGHLMEHARVGRRRRG